ncbi:MAG: TRAP-type mannitol/chloroaromatic compound transport system substrate-binding protein [Granulosicoccus sp.]|jgi:TRAP-type mannitol/chloroaromatic compound transport system substrate-binding protein
MPRRRFLTKGVKGIGIATAASTRIISAPAIAQSSTQLTIVSTWSRDFPGLGVYADYFQPHRA